MTNPPPFRALIRAMDSPGELIRDVRRRHRLSQARLALRAGTTQTAISRLERGKRSPTVDTLRRLLLVMGEELDLSARPLQGSHDPVHLVAELRLSPAARLERAFGWTSFNDELSTASRRGRR